MRRLLFLFATIILLTSCSESYDDAYSRGYGDGYASGYNSTCNIRTTLIAGDFDKRGYQDGYNAGRSDGSNDCIVDRANDNVRY